MNLRLKKSPKSLEKDKKLLVDNFSTTKKHDLCINGKIMCRLDSKS